MRSSTFMVAAVAMTAIAGCMSAPQGTTTTSLGAAPASTAPTVTVTTSAPSTTSTIISTATSVTGPPPEPEYVADVSDGVSMSPESLPGSAGALGSGCAPGGGEGLPDGIWFGSAAGLGWLLPSGQEGAILDFDLACLYVGELAAEKAKEAGEEAFDYYIENQNAKIRSLAVSPGAPVWWIEASAGLEYQKGTLEKWPEAGSLYDGYCPDQGCPIWLYINQGLVTEIVEQYFP